jgi:hypothetical protein
MLEIFDSILKLDSEARKWTGKKMMRTVKDQIIDELDNLTIEQQEQLLSLARRLQRSKLPPDTPGSVLLAYKNQFDFAPGEIDEMMRVIEEECERIDWDGWQ